MSIRPAHQKGEQTNPSKMVAGMTGVLVIITDKIAVKQ